MSGTLRLRGATSGYSELQAPAVAADQTFVLPTSGGTLLTTDSPIAELTLQLGSASAPALRFEGDTDTGLYSSGTNTLNLVTGGSNRLNIDSLGRVSIGTSSALTGSTLTVAGNALAVTGQNTAHSANSIRIGEEGSGAAQIRCYGPDASTNGSLTLRVSRSDGSNSQDVKIDSSGNVGIGTTSPSTLLHLETGHAKQTLKSTNTNTASSIIFDTTNVTTADFLLGQIAGKWNGTDVAQINFEAGSDTTNKDDGIISFATSAASGSPTERMRIDSSGRVGIGTTSIDASLHVKGVGTHGTFVLEAGGTSGASNQIYIQGHNNAGTSLGELHFEETATNQGAVVFKTNGGSVGERMRIDSSGNVGIGTTSSNVILTLDKGSTNSLIGFRQSGTQCGYVGSSNGTNSVVVGAAANDMNIRATNSNINFSVNDGNSRQMIIADTGRVGIGANENTQSFAEKLQVTGDHSGQYAIAAKITASSGSLMRFGNSGGVCGSITCGTSSTAYNTSSDYRLKENVVDLTAAIPRLKTLPVHRFNFITDGEITVDGFLAHEAQLVVPESVTGTHNEVDGDGNPVMQSIDQAKLVPLLTAALQEAIAKIETLETKVAALEAD